MSDWAVALTPPRWRRWLLDATPHSRLQARLSRAYLGWLAFTRNPLAMLGLLIFIVLIAMAIMAPLVAPKSPIAGDLGQRLLPPGGEYWLGTDSQGRDIWSRIVYGSRTTLLIVFMVAITAAPIGIVIGATAGYLGGWVEGVLMRLTDAFLAFPKLVLALAFAAALGPGIENAVLAIALTGLAALCAHRAGGDADRARHRLCGGGADQRRLGPAHPARPHHADVHAIPDRARLARHGRRDPDRGRPRLPRPRRRAAAAGMGRHGVGRPHPDPGAMVGLHLSRHRHLHRQPRFQPDRRRIARRARSRGTADDGATEPDPRSREAEHPVQDAGRRSACGARRQLRHGAREAGHRRRIRLRQVADRARHPRPHARQGDGAEARLPRPEPARPSPRSNGARSAASASPW